MHVQIVVMGIFDKFRTVLRLLEVRKLVAVCMVCISACVLTTGNAVVAIAPIASVGRGNTHSLHPFIISYFQRAFQSSRFLNFEAILAGSRLTNLELPDV